MEELQDALAKTQEMLTEAMRKRDMPLVLSASDAVREVERQIEKILKATAKERFEANKEAREAASAELTSTLTAFASNERVVAAVALGITGFGVTFKDGKAEVNIRTTGAPRAKSTGNATSGGNKGRLVHVVEGNEYSSREFLTTFGEGAFGAEAMQKIWERQASGGGFDQSVKALGKKLAEDGKGYKLMKRVDGELVEA